MVHHAWGARNEEPILECADLSALWFGCDLSQPDRAHWVRTRRQAAADQSADRSAHSKKSVLRCVKIFAKREWLL